MSPAEGPNPAQDLAAWMAQWWAHVLPPAPQGLVQPILPGWTLSGLTINSQNSAAPQTEAEIVQQYSYGRQLGRISDALEALIEQRPAPAPDDDRITVFITMKHEIDEMKLDAAAARVRQLEADLNALKAQRPEEYRRLRAAVRAVLDSSAESDD
jgi:hypothetical protein